MSATARGGAYSDNGAYYTDPRLCRAIVNALPLEPGQVVLEGHAGSGHFLQALLERSDRDDLGLRLLAMDIDPECPAMAVPSPRYERRVQSFLGTPVTWTSPKNGKTYSVQTADPYPGDWPSPDWVIGNPPFGIKLNVPKTIRKTAVPVAEAHLWRALELTTRHVCFVLRAGFMASAIRNRTGGVLRVHPKRGDWDLSPRPSFSGAGNDMATYVAAWWDDQWSPAGGDPHFTAGTGVMLWAD